MRDEAVATITRKEDGGPGGACALRVSREDFARLQPGMLVTLSRLGWGPLSLWRLRQDAP